MQSETIRGGVTLLSCVGGGPIARLTDVLNGDGWSAGESTQYSPMSWRRMMSIGTVGRLVARWNSFIVYPYKSMIEIAKRGGVAVVTTNPFFVPFWLTITKPLHGRPVVVLAYDLYPDALEAINRIDRASALSRILIGMNRAMFSLADAVVFIGPRMAQHAIGRYGKPREWEVIETGAVASEFEERSEEKEAETELERWCHDRFVVGYVGNLGMVHDWKAIEGGIPRFLDKAKSRGIRVGFVLVASGPGVEYLRKAWGEESIEEIRFENPLDDRAWARLLSRCAISIATLREDAVNTSIPSKAFSAMAAGSVIVAVAPRKSDLAHIVLENECGDVVPPENERRLADVLMRYAERIGDRERASSAARRAAKTKYDLRVLGKKWDRLLLSVSERYRERINTRTFAGKRAFDLVGASALLTVSSPVLLVSMVGVRAFLGKGVFFRQRRPGLGGRTFELVKLRTMRDLKDGEAHLNSDAKRMTRFGAFLRKTSVDELPTLWNVMRGNMSLVGPRPLLTEYLEKYTEKQSRRHEVKPGITGWAQVNGRNSITWEEKFLHDVWYVDNWSLILDLKILIMTLLKVVERDGISAAGEATMPEFLGSNVIDRAAEEGVAT